MGSLSQKVGWREERKPLRSASGFHNKHMGAHIEKMKFLPPDPFFPAPQPFHLVFHKEAESDSSDRVLRTPSMCPVVVSTVDDEQSIGCIYNTFTLLCPLRGVLDNYLALLQDWI